MCACQQKPKSQSPRQSSGYFCPSGTAHALSCPEGYFCPSAASNISCDAKASPESWKVLFGLLAVNPLPCRLWQVTGKFLDGACLDKKLASHD